MFRSNHDEMEGGYACAYTHECPDCDAQGTRIDHGYDDDGVFFEVFECNECETHFDHDGDYIFEGSDYSDRMTERAQMGLSAF